MCSNNVVLANFSCFSYFAVNKYISKYEKLETVCGTALYSVQ